jgi:hypothetical protein
MPRSPAKASRSAPSATLSVFRQGGNKGEVQPGMGERDGCQREAAGDSDDNKQRRRAARQQCQPEMTPATGSNADETVPGL